MSRDGSLREVNLVKDVRDAVHGIPEGAIWVIQSAAVLVYQVELWRPSMWCPALIVARVTRAMRARGRERGTDHESTKTRGQPSSKYHAVCAGVSVPVRAELDERRARL